MTTEIIESFEVVDICVRCKVEMVCVAVRNGFYCASCFTDSVENRIKCSLVRSNKVNEVDEGLRKHVLVGCTTGVSSAVLASVLCGYMFNDNRVKSRFSKITLAHVDTSAVTQCIIDSTILDQYNLPVAVCKLEDVLISAPPQERRAVLIELISGLETQNAKEELISILKFHRLRQLAHEFGCHGILLGDSNTRIAINVISMTTRGKGYTIPIETSAITDWYDNLFIMRLLHNIDIKECHYYAHYKQIKYFENQINTTQESTIDSLTESNL